MADLCAIEFVYKGRLCGLEYRADSWEDAEAKLQAIKETGRVVGYPCWTIPFPVIPFLPKPIAFAIGNILVRIFMRFNR